MNWYCNGIWFYLGNRRLQPVPWAYKIPPLEFILDCCSASEPKANIAYAILQVVAVDYKQFKMKRTLSRIALAEVSQVIVNSAKVQVDFIKATGRAWGTGFIPEEKLLGN